MHKFIVGEKFLFQGSQCKVLKILGCLNALDSQLYKIERLSSGYIFLCYGSDMIKLNAVKRNRFKDSPYA